MACTTDSPTVEQRDKCQNRACKIDSLPDVRPDIFKHGACKENTPPTQDETDSITGRVIDSTPGERRDRLQHRAFKRISRTAYGRDRLQQGACNTDSRFGERRDRCQDGAYKIDSPPDVGPDRFQHGACKRDSPSAKLSNRLLHGTCKRNCRYDKL